MKQLGGSTYQLLLFVLAIFAFTIVLATFPVKAFALDAATQTSQVLPAGGNNCPAVSATNFTPYIYEGGLHSFEFTVSDASYVALAGSAGNTPISFNLVTRKTDPSGMLRLHVDIETTPISGTLPLKVTLLSARAGSPVCMTVVSVGVSSAGLAPVQNISSVNTIPRTVTAAPTTSGSSATPAPKPSTSTDPVPTSKQVLTTSMPDGSAVGTAKVAFGKMCSSETSAYRLWLILLVLYILTVGAILWAEFPVSATWARTPERVATITLVLLLLLLTFWYFSISCRAALWMPLMAFLVAVLGLLAAFWNHPRVTQMLLIQETKQPTPAPVKTTSPTIITPPAKVVVPPAKK